MFHQSTNELPPNQPGDGAKHPLQIALEDPGNCSLLAQCRKSTLEAVRIQLVRVQSDPVVDLRVWREEGYGGASTVKGFGIALDRFPKLVAAITRAGKLLEALNLTNPTGAVASSRESEDSPEPRVLVQFQKNLQEQLRIRLIYLGGAPIADLRVFKYHGGDYIFTGKGFGIQTRKVPKLGKAVTQAERQLKRLFEPGQAGGHGLG